MKNKKGFTLVEMLVVLGIICVLALIITPAIISYRNKANNEYNDKLKDNYNNLKLYRSKRYGDKYVTIYHKVID